MGIDESMNALGRLMCDKYESLANAFETPGSAIGINLPPTPKADQSF